MTSRPRLSRRKLVLLALCVSATHAPAARGQELPFDPDAEVRAATAEDIHVLDPYIGRFRSPTTENERLGEPTYHEVTYRWIDEGRTTAAFRVATIGAESGEEHSFVEGYYGYDPFDRRLFAVAAFSWGGAGIASVGEFDLETGYRVIHARAPGADGTVTRIRDVFDVIDADTWRDRTYASAGDGDEWTLVYEDVFSRVD